MHEYMITPFGVLGSDSFYVKAHSDQEAWERAKERISKEGWSSSLGWTIMKVLRTFYY